MFKIEEWNGIKPKYVNGTVILGNGASMAISKNFGYTTLLQDVQQRGRLSSDVNKLFSFFDTEDFELVLRLVWQASKVNESLGIPDGVTRAAYLDVRECLIEAVRNVHPSFDSVRHHLPQMHDYLKTFDTVLSLNYDLLVYWAMAYGWEIEDSHVFKDCFLSGKFDDNWSRFRARVRGESASTLVFYPHGNLALIRNLVEQEFKVSAHSSGLLETILKEWQSERYVPIFVSEGTMEQKVSSIQSSYYLATVFREVLNAPRSTLTLYGWAMGEHDVHILQRMRGRGIGRVAISVYRKNQEFCRRAYQMVQHHMGPLPVEFFDSESPGCWIYPPQ